MKGHLAKLISRHHALGVIDWIGLRPERLAEMVAVTNAEVNETGLKGDHGRKGKRALTLIQAEHLPVIAALSGHADIDPKLLRRNIVVSGINLSALRHQPLKIGTAHIKITAQCAPCSRMETALGAGGYNAMRGHGGWCAEVLEPGDIQTGSTVLPVNIK